MAFDAKFHIRADRYMNKWEAQLFQGNVVVPPFRLAFPSSSLCLDQQTRNRNKEIWAKNQVCIEASESPFATVVSFYIIDKSVQQLKHGETLGYTLAVLPAWKEKNLWVRVNHEYEWNMLKVIANAIGELDKRTEEGTLEEIRKMPDGKIMTVTVSGPSADGSVYFMPFSIGRSDKQ